MSRSDHSLTSQDSSTTDLLHVVLERLCVSERGNLLRALEQTSDFANEVDELPGASEEMSFDAAREQMRIDLMDEVSQLSSREALLFKRWAEGVVLSEIASEINESLPTVNRELKSLQKRLLYRLSKQQDHRSGTKVSAPASRLAAFEQLQRRLSLTSAEAAAWQNAVREARR